MGCLLILNSLYRLIHYHGSNSYIHDNGFQTSLTTNLSSYIQLLPRHLYVAILKAPQINLFKMKLDLPLCACIHYYIWLLLSVPYTSEWLDQSSGSQFLFRNLSWFLHSLITSQTQSLIKFDPFYRLNFSWLLWSEPLLCPLFPFVWFALFLTPIPLLSDLLLILHISSSATFSQKSFSLDWIS